MKIFIDVTSSCRSGQNTGMQRMTRRIFAELNQRLDVRPISWNTAGNFYTELGPRELQLLTRPFVARSGAMAHRRFVAAIRHRMRPPMSPTRTE